MKKKQNIDWMEKKRGVKEIVMESVCYKSAHGGSFMLQFKKGLAIVGKHMSCILIKSEKCNKQTSHEKARVIKLKCLIYAETAHFASENFPNLVT